MTSRRALRLLTGAAAAVPVALAAALIPLRGHIDNANMALLLVITVVAFASSGRRGPALLAALSAAIGFNLFHTVPYLSLRITSRDDAVTTALLLIVGLVVGEIALRGRRARVVAAQERRDLDLIAGLGALVATGEDPHYVLLAASTELTHLLQLVDCRYEREPRNQAILPTIHRDGSVMWGPIPWETERWGLPTDGAVIPVWSHGRQRGRFVLNAPVALPYSRSDLARAVAVVDQAGAALGSATRAA